MQLTLRGEFLSFDWLVITLYRRVIRGKYIVSIHVTLVDGFSLLLCIDLLFMVFMLIIGKNFMIWLMWVVTHGSLAVTPM